MKATEKKQAIVLRRQGFSIKEISRSLGVAKSSVSLWVRDVELTETQKIYLLNKGLFKEEIERRRKTRLANEQIKRDVVINSAKKMVPKISNKQLFLMGLMLYWAEGGKTRKLVRFNNSDPNMIRIMMVFFREICDVPENKFRGYIHIHSHLDDKKAMAYWSEISNISLGQFYKPYRKQSKSSQRKKDSLPYGTFDVYVLDTQLFYKITGWTKGIYEQFQSVQKFMLKD